MKLSEAIRLNGMMKPQGWGPGSMVSLDAPCALGGALQSIGKQPKHEREAYGAIAENWAFARKPAKCPCGSDHCAIQGKKLDIAIVIALLNDYHGWTRDQIADWVATVEPAEEVEPGLIEVMLDQVRKVVERCEAEFRLGGWPPGYA